MQIDKYKVAIIGSGPAGTSAAARAAELGVSHVLLESAPHLANTTYRYQKGKHVMAEPQMLPLRSLLPFKAGTREQILQAWNGVIEQQGVNVRFNAEVTSLSGSAGNFTLILSDGSRVEAENVVLAIGLQGNIRKLGVTGESLPFVQYQLDDPEEYKNETIVVIGAGDAAIENALALSQNNKVTIVNRRDEFARAKEGNLTRILAAIERGEIDCLYSSSVKQVVALEQSYSHEKPGLATFNSSEGEIELPLDRIIARLGAIPPRRFVESCGIHFPSKDPSAIPVLSEHYQSNIDGLYIIGALAGYPLIKQAINQGYEVIEYIEGHDVEPADEPLLQQKFAAVSDVSNVAEGLELIQQCIPLFSELTPLQLREFLLESEIHTPQPGELVFERGHYGTTIFSILSGEVSIWGDLNDRQPLVVRHQGDFFGEMSLISGRPRMASVQAGSGCVLIETPRRSMNKLINSIKSVERHINETFLFRAITLDIAPEVPREELSKILHSAEIRHFASGETIFKQGDEGDTLHLIRVGSVAVSRQSSCGEQVIAYLPAGNYIGEMALLNNAPRSATVRAAVKTETISLQGELFRELLDRIPKLRRHLEEKYQRHIRSDALSVGRGQYGEMISFLMDEGLGEATDVLIIDDALCIRCDNCEKACASTHNGTSRLQRDAGPVFEAIHLPTSCRHCENPRCMIDCPPNALHRGVNGEIHIANNCIGCGNCRNNCPYGVIRMAPVKQEQYSLWSWLLFGRGSEPGTSTGVAAGDSNGSKAVKCDMCKDHAGGPACVRSCPTGAALRIHPEEFIRYQAGALSGGCE